MIGLLSTCGPHMTLNQKLNEFNQRFAAELLPSFPKGIVAMEDDSGMLCFRGVIPNSGDSKHGTHVTVTLEDDVVAALALASPAEREDITQHLIDNLGASIRIQYHPDKIGKYALGIVGTMASVTGR